MQTEERQELIADIIEALNKRTSTLSEDEERWVRMAIQKEAQSIELRKAIIEKTLVGLVWAFFIGAGYVLLDFLKGHGVNV